MAAGASALYPEQTDASAAFAALVDKMPAGRYGAPANDLSAASYEKALQQTKDRLAELRKIDLHKLSPAEQIDWRFAESIRMGNLIEQERIRRWKRDPQTYLSFRSISSTMGRSGDAAAKADTVLRALQLVPKQLHNGQAQVEVYIPRFQELALF